MVFNSLVIISFFILGFDAIEDFLYKDLFFRNSKKVGYLIYLYTFTLLGYFGFALIIPDIIKILLICFLLLCFWIIHKYHLISSLETQLSSVLILSSSFLLLQEFWSSLFVSFCVLLTSFSAGIAKLQDKLWTKELNGFHRFLSMPWLTRKNTLKISRFLYSRYYFFRFSCKFLTLLTPYLQIISTSGLFLSVISYLLGYKEVGMVLFLIGISFHILFPILLFIIAGLGNIPIIYITNSFIFAYSFYQIFFQENGFISFFTFISLLYLILFILGFSGIIRQYFPGLLKFLQPFIPKGLHVMFTAHNLEGMVVFNYQKSNNQNINEKKYKSFINPFNSNGYRSNAQNFISTKFFCIYYDLMDLVLCNYDNYGNLCSTKDLNYGTKKRKYFINKLISYLKEGKFNFYQFNWNEENKSYISEKIGSISFDETNRYKSLKKSIPKSFRLELIHTLDNREKIRES